MRVNMIKGRRKESCAGCQEAVYAGLDSDVLHMGWKLEPAAPDFSLCQCRKCDSHSGCFTQTDGSHVFFITNKTLISPQGSRTPLQT